MRRIATPTCFSVPALVMYGVFTVYPIYRQFDISFFNWHIFPGASNPFVGWSNYTAIFSDPVVRTASFNSFLFIVITVPIQMAIGLFAAAVLTDRLPGSMFWRAAVYVPVVTSWVVVSWVFSYIFASQGGIMNALVGFFAGHTVSIDWTAQTWTANGVIWLLSIWKGVGWSFIIFLAALDGIPRELLESARTDGAQKLRVWRHVVLPSIRRRSHFRHRAARHRRRAGVHSDLRDNQGWPLQLDAVTHDLHVPAGFFITSPSATRPPWRRCSPWCCSVSARPRSASCDAKTCKGRDHGTGNRNRRGQGGGAARGNRPGLFGIRRRNRARLGHRRRVLALFSLGPLLYMLSLSFQQTGVFSGPQCSIPTHPTVQNYVQAWTENSFSHYFFNSLFVAIATVAITVVFASLAAFAFARYTFPLKQVIFYVFLASLAVPNLLLLIPQFLLMDRLHLLNSLVGLTFLYVASNLPFTIFLLTRLLRGDTTRIRGVLPPGRGRDAAGARRPDRAPGAAGGGRGFDVHL